MKVIHVLRQLNPGGIECWLERLIRHWREDSPEFHFALEDNDFGSMASRFQELGVVLHHCPPPRQIVASWSSFDRLLSDFGPFSAVHCHNHHASGFALAIAAKRGVPVRITHSHADFRGRSRGVRTAYEWLARHWIRVFSTVRLAVGAGAAQDLYGVHGPEAEILPCGADFEALVGLDPKPDPDHFTLVHVGRLVPEKNHEFLIRIVAELIQRETSTRLWLVGDGPLRGALEQMVADLGLQRHIEFLGTRHDVASILSRSDCFVFPSHCEGLGLAAIEAQAAGLPVLLAQHLPTELELIPSRCRRLALELPVNEWVNAVLELRKFSVMPSSARRAIAESSVGSIEANIRMLRKIYAS
jgi:glycosyltransferase involved in cell wall biosynthesis